MAPRSRRCGPCAIAPDQWAWSQKDIPPGSSSCLPLPRSPGRLLHMIPAPLGVLTIFSCPFPGLLPSSTCPGFIRSPFIVYSVNRAARGRSYCWHSTVPQLCTARPVPFSASFYGCRVLCGEHRGLAASNLFCFLVWGRKRRTRGHHCVKRLP